MHNMTHLEIQNLGRKKGEGTLCLNRQDYWGLNSMKENYDLISKRKGGYF